MSRTDDIIRQHRTTQAEAARARVVTARPVATASERHSRMFAGPPSPSPDGAGLRYRHRHPTLGSRYRRKTAHRCRHRPAGGLEDRRQDDPAQRAAARDPGQRPAGNPYVITGAKEGDDLKDLQSPGGGCARRRARSRADPRSASLLCQSSPSLSRLNASNLLYIHNFLISSVVIQHLPNGIPCTSRHRIHLKTCRNSRSQEPLFQFCPRNRTLSFDHDVRPRR